MTPRREMALALGLVALGAAVTLVGGARSSGAAPAVPGVPAAPGADPGAGGPAALALVALAGAGAVLLARARGRRVLGAVLVLVGAGLVGTGTSPVRWTVLAGGVLVALGALATVLRARRWPQPRSRYDAPRRDRTASPRDTWDALDRGEDPTT